MPKTTTPLYGGMPRSSNHSQINNCALPTAILGIMGILRILQEGISFDPIGIVLLITAIAVYFLGK